MQEKPCVSVLVRRIHAVVLLAQLQPSLIAVNQALKLLSVQLHRSLHGHATHTHTLKTNVCLQEPCACRCIYLVGVYDGYTEEVLVVLDVRGSLPAEENRTAAQHEHSHQAGVAAFLDVPENFGTHWL